MRRSVSNVVNDLYWLAFQQKPGSRIPDAEAGMKVLVQIYDGITAKLNYLQSPFLLAIRLYWGWQFAQSGWGKMHNVPKVTGFFESLNIPFAAFNAHFISGLEFFGGLLLILGLASRMTGFLLAANMLAAYWTADHDALVSVFSDPGKFYIADPYTFLFASLMVLVFGAGALSVDTLFQRLAGGRGRPS